MLSKIVLYVLAGSLVIISGCSTAPTSSLPYGDDGLSVPDEKVTSTTIDFYATTTSSTLSKPTNTTTMEYNAAKHYTAILHTTAGDIEIALNFGQTPNTVKNFVDLAHKSFYNGTIFHRVIKGFMIQGGDPKGDGTGGPGYKFADEPFTGEYSRGTVAMANAGPNTNGSQFFIMHADYPLPKSYVIFGKVNKGLDVVDKIANSEVVISDSGEPSKPVSPTKVISVEIKEE
jgi:cyclophilin family peptidyl-prolyl cis-trans isomerase